MALLERVSTLVRANLNDLIDKAEHPEKMIKQVIIDMQNQLLQVKTQVAIAIADQHLLEQKQKENGDKVSEWMRKAELAVDKKQDDLARVALQRVESCRDLSDGFGQQVTDQKAQVENLKTALRQLEQKLTEAQAKADLLIAQHRRARAVGKASDAKLAIGDNSKRYRRYCIKKLNGSWPELGEKKLGRITEAECKAWAGRFSLRPVR